MEKIEEKQGEQIEEEDDKKGIFTRKNNIKLHSELQKKSLISSGGPINEEGDSDVNLQGFHNLNNTNGTNNSTQNKAKDSQFKQQNSKNLPNSHNQASSSSAGCPMKTNDMFNNPNIEVERPQNNTRNNFNIEGLQIPEYVSKVYPKFLIPNKSTSKMSISESSNNDKNNNTQSINSNSSINDHFKNSIEYQEAPINVAPFNPELKAIRDYGKTLKKKYIFPQEHEIIKKNPFTHHFPLKLKQDQNEIYYCKKLITKNNNRKQEIEREVENICNIKKYKRNLVKIYEIHTITTLNDNTIPYRKDELKDDEFTFECYIIMEKGIRDLEQDIKSRRNQIKKQYYNFQEVKLLIRELLRALYQLREENISHRDIKPANILIFEENGEIIFKLADFGLSKLDKSLYEENIERSNACGTINYMSPEMILRRNNQYSGYISYFLNDVFGLGMTLLQAITLLSYEELSGLNEMPNGPTLISDIIQKQIDDPNIQELLFHMLQFEPKYRAGIDQLSMYYSNFL